MSYDWKAHVFAFPTTCHSLQSVTSEWRYGTVNLICDPPVFRGSSLRPKWGVCNEWDIVGKVTQHMGFPMTSHLIHRIYHISKNKRMKTVTKLFLRSLPKDFTPIRQKISTNPRQLVSYKHVFQWGGKSFSPRSMLKNSQNCDAKAPNGWVKSNVGITVTVYMDKLYMKIGNMIYLCEITQLKTKRLKMFRYQPIVIFKTTFATVSYLLHYTCMAGHFYNNKNALKLSCFK